VVGGAVKVTLTPGLNITITVGDISLPTGTATAILQHGAYGNVDVSKGVLIGIPAMFGVVVGTTLQQRVPVRFLNGLFAVLMLVSAATLVF